MLRNKSYKSNFAPIFFGFYFFIFFFSVPSLAKEVRLSEKRILLKCYAHLTGERLPLTSTLWSRLQQTRAQNICMELLDSVALGSDGVLEQKDNLVHRKVLRQFYDIHRSWFSSQWASDSNAPESSFGTVDVIDPTEPSLHITKNLFSRSSLHYKEVLIGNTHLKALREPGPFFPHSIFTNDVRRPSRVLMGSNQFFSTSQIQVHLDNNGNNFYNVGFDIIQLGDLFGITTDRSPLINDVWSNPQTSTAVLNEADIRRPAAVRNNFGGGALGSSAYFLMTLGHPYNYRADGAQKLPRRWTESVFKNFLCKEAPYVREADAQSYLVTDPNAAPFRQSISCLRCHTALDQAATTARNIRYGATLNFPNTEVRRHTSVITEYIPSLGQNTSWPAVSTSNFHLTSPTGRLFFRDRKGNLVDRSLSSISDLGAALSDNEDYYTCAAQRYFGYFTGIELNLEYLTNPIHASTLSPADLEYRDYVIGLGQELQQTGSLKKLIQTILQSGYYQHEQRKR